MNYGHVGYGIAFCDYEMRLIAVYPTYEEAYKALKNLLNVQGMHHGYIYAHLYIDSNGEFKSYRRYTISKG